MLATLREDGSPRVSGTEVRFEDGQLTMGSMPGALKARDLRRDPRCALHANPGDGTMRGGDAKIAGRAVELPPAGDPPEQGPHMFLLDLSEAVLTSVAQGGGHLLIEVWRPGAGVKRIERR